MMMAQSIKVLTLALTQRQRLKNNTAKQLAAVINYLQQEQRQHQQLQQYQQSYQKKGCQQGEVSLAEIKRLRQFFYQLGQVIQQQGEKIAHLQQKQQALQTLLAQQQYKVTLLEQHIQDKRQQGQQQAEKKQQCLVDELSARKYQR